MGPNLRNNVNVNRDSFTFMRIEMGLLLSLSLSLPTKEQPKRKTPNPTKFTKPTSTRNIANNHMEPLADPPLSDSQYPLPIQEPFAFENVDSPDDLLQKHAESLLKLKQDPDLVTSDGNIAVITNMEDLVAFEEHELALEMLRLKSESMSIDSKSDPSESQYSDIVVSQVFAIGDQLVEFSKFPASAISHEMIDPITEQYEDLLKKVAFSAQYGQDEELASLLQNLNNKIIPMKKMADENRKLKTEFQ